MALRWIESFGLYGSIAASQVNWAYSYFSTAYYSVPATGGRTGGPCFQAVANNALLISRGLGGPASGVILGFAIKLTSGLGNGTLVYFSSAGSAWYSLWYNGGTGAISITTGNGGTIKATSTVPLPLNTWAYIEFKYTIDPSAGVVELRQNGVVTATFTGNTGSAGGTVDGVVFPFLAGYGTTLCDLYCLDTTGSAPLNSYLGDCRVDYLVPNADTSQKDFVPSSGSSNYTQVREIPPDDDSSYVSSSTAGAKDLYAMSDLAVTPQSIFAVQATLRARKDDAGTRIIRPIIKSGAVQGNGPSFAPGTSYSTVAGLFPLDPNTGAAWTAAGVNAMQAGVEILT